MSSPSYQYLFQPAKDPTAPPLLLLHGTGGSERDLLPLAEAVSPGSAVLSPLGMVSEGGARRFFPRLAEGVFDPNAVVRHAEDLADFLERAMGEHGIEPGSLIAVGFSNGANIAATLLQLQPTILAGASLLRAMVVLDRAAAPGTLSGKRVLLVNGTRDPYVPPDHPPRLAALLRAGGAEVTLRTHTAGHGLIPADLHAIRDWLGS